MPNHLIGTALCTWHSSSISSRIEWECDGNTYHRYVEYARTGMYLVLMSTASSITMLQLKAALKQVRVRMCHTSTTRHGCCLWGDCCKYYHRHQPSTFFDIEFYGNRTKSASRTSTPAAIYVGPRRRRDARAHLCLLHPSFAPAYFRSSALPPFRRLSAAFR